jgi:ribosome maturation factor RimP
VIVHFRKATADPKIYEAHGIVAGCENSMITLATKAGEIKINLSDIAHAKLELEF